MNVIAEPFRRVTCGPCRRGLHDRGRRRTCECECGWPWGKQTAEWAKGAARFAVDYNDWVAATYPTAEADLLGDLPTELHAIKADTHTVTDEAGQ